MRPASALLALLSACNSGVVKLDTAETGEPLVPVAASDLSWALHPEMESLVYASWTQDGDAPVHVEVSVDEGVWIPSPSFDGVAGPNQQLLAGIPFASEASWRVVIEGQESYDGPTITTGELPSGLPTPTVTVSDPTRWLSEGNYLLSSINEKRGGWTTGTYWTFILDRQGRVVWARYAPERNWTLFAQVALSGDAILWDDATYWSDYDDGAGSSVHRTWLDEEIEEIPTPGLHHAFVQLPDGSLAWGSQDHGGGEALVELAPGAKEPEVLWTCREDWEGSGDCESNGLFYQPSTDSFLYSFYTNNSVVEVDRATGQSLWWAGDVDGGFSFEPEDSQFSWQHGVSYTSSGTLLVSTAWPYEGRSQATDLAEYEVDREKGTLTWVWGSESGVLANTNGDAWRLDNGNTLHVVGSASVIREVDPDGVDVWRVEFEGDRLLGRGEFIADLYDLVKPRAE